MKSKILFLVLITAALITGCFDSGDGGGNPGERIVTISAIPGVVVPVRGAVPDTTAIDTDQYTGTITWSPGDNPFTATTVYTANIVLTAKAGFTFTGVSENFFTVAGAIATNAADSGTVTAVFPVTGSIADIDVIFQGAEQTGGTDGRADSTGLILTFDIDPAALTVDNITVTGATRGALSGSGKTRTLTISNISVGNGETVSVTITSPAGYAITGSPKTAVVYKRGYILFAANDAEHGRELWKTDGTSEGTVFVKDIWEGPEVAGSGGGFSKKLSKDSGIPGLTGSSCPGNFVWFNNKYYFSADDGNGAALWTSDGTTAGTIKVSSNTGWSELLNLVCIKTKLYFSTRNSSGDYNILESDGTETGTRELNTGAGYLEYGIVMNSKGYFICNYNGTLKLWELDGTAGLKRAAGTESLYSTSGAVLFNGKIYFKNQDTALLYSYDGTAVTQFTNTTDYPNPVIEGVFNGKLFFSTYVTSTGPCKMWVTDGTNTKDLGVIAWRPKEITALDGKVFYIAQKDPSATGETGCYIGKTDGESEISEIKLDGECENLTMFNNNIYFTRTANVDSSYQTTLYRYNGTATPDIVTSKAKFMQAFQILNGKLIFAGATASEGSEPWVSDGTEAGTVMLEDIYTGKYTSSYDGKEYPNSSAPFVMQGY